jgi:hypothetical protein
MACALHEELIDVIRFDAGPEIRKFAGLVTVTPGDGGLVTMLLGLRYPKERARPDVWIWNDSTGELIAVEVGHVPEDKWQGLYAVIHVSFMGGVALIDQRGTALEKFALRCIRDACDEFIKKRGTTAGMKVEF